MTIELHCATCDTTISTRADAAGKFTKCPGCGGELRALHGPPAPTQEQPLGPAPPALRTAESSEERPLSPIPVPSLRPPPRIERKSGRTATLPTGKPSPTASPASGPVLSKVDAKRIEFGRTIGCAWRLFGKNILLLLPVSLVLIGILALLLLIPYVPLVASVTLGMAISPKEPTFFSGILIAFGFVVSIVAGIGVIFLYSWFEAGWTRLFVRLARGEPRSFTDLFRGAPGVWRLFGFNVLRVLVYPLLTLICAAPFLAIIIAISSKLTGSDWEDSLIFCGLVVEMAAFFVWCATGLFLYLTPYLIVDRNLGVCASMWASLRFMRGNKRTLAGIYVVAGSLAMGFVLVTCSLGSLAVMPFFMLLSAIVYVTATGQPLAPAGLVPPAPPPVPPPVVVPKPAG